MRPVHLSLLALLAAGVAAPAVDVAAAQRAAFEARLTGTQVTTWHFEQPADPEDPCSTATVGDGDQTIAFATASPLKLQAERRRRGRGWSRPDLRLRPARVGATADRHGELRSVGTPPDSCDPEVVGGGEPCTDCPPPPPPDCGRREGAVALWLSFGDRFDNGDLAPLVRPPRDELELAAAPDGWRGGEIAPLTGMPLGATFEDCPFWMGGPEAPAEEDGGLIPALERVPERTLFDRRRKRLVVHGSASRCYSASGIVPCGGASGRFQGRTVLAFRLELRRARP